ncbi:hypothetical protein P886_4703 [Alteromonadaceae bacterium 2753L.S.0a.02]|nr:hypothetical protein P886_4703 [Alteromonadaceae bacterium 2753L.S.0a.02]
MEPLNFYLSAADAYGNQASTVFNMFLTVLFGSLGFAAAFPLRDVGKRRFGLSASSKLIGGALLSFYIISFVSFYHLSNQANGLIGIIVKQSSNGQLAKEAIEILGAPSWQPFGVSLPILGFGIGSAVGFFAFMWLANVKRNPAQ